MVPSSELPVSCSASLYCFRELVSDSHWIKFSLLVQVVHTRNFAARIWDRLRLDLSAAFSPCFPAPQQWRLDSVSGIVSFLFFFFFSPLRHGVVTLITSTQKPPGTSAGPIPTFSFRQAVPSIYSFIPCDVIRWCLV